MLVTSGLNLLHGVVVMINEEQHKLLWAIAGEEGSVLKMKQLNKRLALT